MQTARLLFRSVFFRFKAKRVIPIEKATVRIGSETQALSHPESLSNQAVDVSKVPWEAMNLEELSQLGGKTLNAINYELNKTKVTSLGDQQPILQGQSPPSTDKLNPSLLKTYQKLVEVQSHPPLKQGRLAELYDLNITNNPEIAQLIETTYSKLSTPQSLLSTVQPSLIKYLVGLNSDLSRVGFRLQDHIVKVESARPIDIEYEFWVGVHRNRSRNYSEDRYVSYFKDIDNPNNSLLMQQTVNRRIRIHYIIIKRRPEKYFVGFMVKATLEVRLANHGTHYIKIEFEGPRYVNNSVQLKPVITPNYRIIDIDGVMNGNPTIPSVFRFG